MKFRQLKFHSLCFVSKAFSRSLYISQERSIEIEKWKRQVQRVVCSSFVAHKYIDKRTIVVHKYIDKRTIVVHKYIDKRTFSHDET